MKDIKYILSLLLFLMLWGCENFLEKFPHDQLSDGTFWRDESDLQKGLTACYASLYSEYFSGGHMDQGVRVYFDALVDNLYVAYYWGIPDVTIGSLNPTTSGLPTGYYSACFDLISRANIFLSKIELVNIDETKKVKFRAQARFLRAFAYHELVLNYGGVPLYESAATIEDASKGRSSKEEVYTLIHKDLDYAIANLTDESFKGNVVKNSALGLKARVCLYSKDWSGAVENAQKVISSGKTSLYSNYQAMFNKRQGNDNTEILFSVKFLADNLYHNFDIKLGKHGHYNVLEDLVDDYLTINGLPIDKDLAYNPNALWENRDPRLQLSVFCKPGESWAYNPTKGYVPYTEMGVTAFRGKKGINLNIQAGYDTRSDQDVIHLRYADVLMMFAEAKNELGQFTKNEWDQSIRLIRARAGFTVANALNFPGGTQDELRQIIRHERRIELAFEGLRYYDLLRWGTIKEELESIQGENPQKKVYNKNKPLWPIPQTQIDYYKANGVTFEQNPGY